MFLRCAKYIRYSMICLGILSLLLIVTPVEVSSEPVRILIVKSAMGTEYDQTVSAIKSSLQMDGMSFVTEEILIVPAQEEEQVFWNNVHRNKPKLIITVGTKATTSAVNFVRDIPIIFTMVLGKIETIESQMISARTKDISGVTLSIPVKDQLTMMLEALPYVRRVGLLYSRESIQTYNAANETTKKMGLRLLANEISSERDIPIVLREILPEIDVFWLPPDAVVYERNNLSYIIRECYTNSIPVIAVSEQFAKAGTPLAFGIDYTDLGKQTAELALRRLSVNSFSTPVIETPRKILLHINKGVATSLGLKIPGRILERAIPVENGR
ncbi:MAG: hypothetical protein JXB48_12880 [Candidatus Latescibacteria bacterium]|nr:hypothetical protein [Candidatus Latescibacterota bacterium]